MKTPSPLLPVSHRRGYVSVVSVVGLSAVLLSMMVSSFRTALDSQQVQKHVQVRIDYSQREQAMLRAVLSEVPNRAITSMTGGSADDGTWENELRWRWVFEEALIAARGEIALDPDHAADLGIDTNAISGNSGDGTHGHVRHVVGPTGSFLTSGFHIVPGIQGATGSLGSNYPEPLVWSDPSALATDRDKVIITDEKRYADGSRYKVLPYPNIHFGYSQQGETFLAKRNWWAFSVSFGRNSEDLTGIKPVVKDYVLSLYEVPSQLALGSTSTTNIGQHRDGSNWANVTIQGSVFADRALTSGNIALEQLATRKGIDLGLGNSVGGVGPDINGLVQSRESFEAANSDFFPLSTSSDSGLVAFIPIHRGADSYQQAENNSDTNRLSPTGWEWYSRPAERCDMKLRLGLTLTSLNTIGFELRFTYKDALGLEVAQSLTGNSIGALLSDTNLQLLLAENELTLNSPGDSDDDDPTVVDYPFTITSTPDQGPGITVHADNLADYVTKLGAGLNNNRSLYFEVQIAADLEGLLELSLPFDLPLINSEFPLVLTGGSDLNAFPNGFSVVTPKTVFLAENINLVQSGVDGAGAPIYPPFSLFSPDLRFGLRETNVDIEFEGSIHNIGHEGADPAAPLDLVSGANTEALPDRITANLFPTKRIEDLPPINQISWLLTIEEVRH